VSDDTLHLFGEPEPEPDPSPSDSASVAPPSSAADSSGARSPDTTVPLAQRLRPRSLDEVVGQQHLLGVGGTLRRMLAAGHLPSLILHGPPGSGKTTLALLLAGQVAASFVPFSAVSEGVPRLREVVREAQARRKGGRRTVLFIDEIHRLNKAQQDFLLPWVESGLLVLIGATTEHPAFEINPALLSRAQVLVLEPLGGEDLRVLLHRAISDAERGLHTGGGEPFRLDAAAEEVFLHGVGGDARRLLSALEAAAGLIGEGGTITEEVAREALLQRTARYDATLGYEMLSAFHKSLRSSSGSGALYWAARMLRGGEDPLVLFRRLVAAAYEDVGLADPQAGIVAVQAMQAFERLGTPEGLLPLANAILYVANAPKSNRAYLALGAAQQAAEANPDAPVPLHLRNAATRLMREWGYGEGYRYAHDYEGGITELECLPDALAGAEFYEPTDRGFERELAARAKARRSANDP
jgi:putative ATPase